MHNSSEYKIYKELYNIKIGNEDFLSSEIIEASIISDDSYFKKLYQRWLLTTWLKSVVFNMSNKHQPEDWFKYLKHLEDNYDLISCQKIAINFIKSGIKNYNWDYRLSDPQKTAFKLRELLESYDYNFTWEKKISLSISIMRLLSDLNNQ